MSVKCNTTLYDVTTSWIVLLHHIITVFVCVCVYTHIYLNLY